jgi:hypothetical protein
MFSRYSMSLNESFRPKTSSAQNQLDRKVAMIPFVQEFVAKP